MLLLSLIFAAVLAQVQVAAAPTPVPNPRPDLAPMMYFSGTWTCHQKLRGSDRPDTSTSSVVMNGRWMKVHDVAPPFDKYRRTSVNSDNYYGYDPELKQYVNVEVDDFGGYSVAYSPGWQGNKMIWTSKTGQLGATGTFTVTKTSDSSYAWNSTGADRNGKAQPAQNGTCKKS